MGLAIVISVVLMCITYFTCKVIQSSAYERVHKEHLKWEKEKYCIDNPSCTKKNSPYKLKRIMHKESQNWGYTIAYKDNDKVYTSVGGFYQILDMEKAKKVLHEMEMAEGCVPTEW